MKRVMEKEGGEKEREGEGEGEREVRISKVTGSVWSMEKRRDEKEKTE